MGVSVIDEERGFNIKANSYKMFTAEYCAVKSPIKTALKTSLGPHLRDDAGRSYNDRHLKGPAHT